MATECEHGQLARSCQLCELEAEIERLRNEDKTLRKALQDIFDYSVDRRYAPIDRLHIILRFVKAALDAAGGKSDADK